MTGLGFEVRAIDAVAHQGGGDRGGGGGGGGVGGGQNKGQVAGGVGAGGAGSGKLLGQRFGGRVVFRRHKGAGSVLAEPVHDARAPDAADPGKAQAAMGDQRV